MNAQGQTCVLSNAFRFRLIRSIQKNSQDASSCFYADRSLPYSERNYSNNIFRLKCAKLHKAKLIKMIALAEINLISLSRKVTIPEIAIAKRNLISFRSQFHLHS